MSKLIIHLPDGNEQWLDLPPGNPVTLGRADDNTVQIDEGVISRHHARLLLDENGACVIEDLGSANGTTINGEAVERFDLQDGDRLAFGGINAVYQIAEPDTPQLATAETAVGQVFACRYRLESALGETDEYNNFVATDTRRVSLKIFDPGVISKAGWPQACQARVPTGPRCACSPESGLPARLRALARRQLPGLGMDRRPSAARPPTTARSFVLCRCPLPSAAGGSGNRSCPHACPPRARLGSARHAFGFRLARKCPGMGTPLA